MNTAKKLLAIGLSVSTLGEGSPACQPRSMAERRAVEVSCVDVVHNVVPDTADGGEDLEISGVIDAPDDVTVTVDSVNGTVFHSLLRGGGKTDFSHPGSSHTINHDGNTTSVDLRVAGTVTAEDGTTATFEKGCGTWADWELLGMDGDGPDDVEVTATGEGADTAYTIRARSIGALATMGNQAVAA